MPAQFGYEVGGESDRAPGMRQDYLAGFGHELNRTA
jgi:hypothetical protein